MGRTSKPLHIQLADVLYQANKIQWDEMTEQGHTIEIIPEPAPDIYLAPYAMRMTADMLAQLPTAISLAVKGARALRYAPKVTTEWKGKASGKNKKARTRKNAAKQVEVVDRAESSNETEDTRVGSEHIV